MISLKSFCPEIKIMNSSFMKIIYINDIFYHLRAVNESKSEVWKGKNLCARGVKTFLVRTVPKKDYSLFVCLSLIESLLHTDDGWSP